MVCKNCDGGVVLYEHIGYITREMAIDAGNRELEGQPISYGTEWVPCPCCQGEFEHCENCEDWT